MQDFIQTNNVDLQIIEKLVDPIDLLKDLTSVKNDDDDTDPFYVVNLDNVIDKHLNWLKLLPRVETFYAVKCNLDPMLLRLLATLGTGFDCASKKEIQTILDLGVSPDRIIYAHPCKETSYVRYAYKNGVDTMTFDNADELYKMKANHPNAKIVLRIKTDDRNARYKLSKKFGADMPTAHKLIDLALELNMNLIGISFHVGSEQMCPDVFTGSIQNARELFDYAENEHGLKMKLLDIGGGYPGSSDYYELFSKMAKAIKTALDEYFPFTENVEDNVRIIAEPGTYYVGSAFTLCANVIARCVTQENSTKSFMYYLNDGLFSSFNNKIYDPDHVFNPILLKTYDADTPMYNSFVWGPTCDGTDCIFKNILFPELCVGDYIAFKNMGAYCLVLATSFNSMPIAKPIYMTTSKTWEIITSSVFLQ